MIFALFLISFGVFLQVLWLIVCFSTIIVGILLLIFAPGILFLPFNLFFTLGMNRLGKEFRSNSNSKYYRYHFKYSNKNNYNKYQYNYTSPKQSDNDKYYEILESKKDDSFDTIKKNYRKLIKKYHYDTIASQNLSKEEIDQAKEKTQKINEAYSIIKEKYKSKI
jgi:hypothetical protein